MCACINTHRACCTCGRNNNTKCIIQIHSVPDGQNTNTQTLAYIKTKNAKKKQSRNAARCMKLQQIRKLSQPKHRAHLFRNVLPPFRSVLYLCRRRNSIHCFTVQCARSRNYLNGIMIEQTVLNSQQSVSVQCSNSLNSRKENSAAVERGKGESTSNVCIWVSQHL